MAQYKQRKMRERSRLVKKENRKIIFQSVALLVFTLVLVAVILVWGIPFFIKVAGYWGEIRSAKSNTNDDQIAPFTPQLTVNYDATGSAVIKLDGYAEADTKITLFRDEDKISETKASENGSFSFDQIRLSEGDNQLSVQAQDSAGNDSQKSKPVDIVLDTSPPEIKLDSPNDGQEFTGEQDRLIKIAGSSEAGADVYINDNFTVVDNSGKFERKQSLNEGDNEIVIRAVDKAGNETKKTIKVKYNK